MKNLKTAKNLKSLFYDWFVLPEYWNTSYQFTSNMVYATILCLLTETPYLRFVAMCVLGFLYLHSLKNTGQRQLIALGVILGGVFLNDFLSIFVIAGWQGMCLMHLEKRMSKPHRNERGFIEDDLPPQFERTMLFGVFKIFLLVVMPLCISYQIAWYNPYAREMRAWEEFTRPRHVWK